MKMYKSIFTLFVISILFTSCQDVIELDVPDSAQSVAISGRVSDQGTTFVTVSTTAGFFSQGQTPRVENAAVVLLEDGDTAAILTPDSVPGLYSTPYNGILGKSYEVSVEIFPGNDAYAASIWKSKPEILTRVYAIDSLQVRFLDRSTTPQVFDAGYYALMFFQETLGEGDNYRITRWKNDSLFTREIFIFEDDFFDGRYIGEDSPFGIPAFNFFGPFDEDQKDSITVEVASISDDYFDFLTIVNEQVFQVGSTFDPPPQTIVGNIYNAEKPAEFGYGYFSASATSIDGVRFTK